MPKADRGVGASRTDSDGRVVNGRAIRMGEAWKNNNFAAAAASYRLVGQWLDTLRALGVYDNTRIILASDHGMTLGGLIDGTQLENGDSIEALNCLLMVKDFGSNEPFRSSEEFHMNADVPALATQGILDGAADPFTGDPLADSDETDSVTVTYVYDVQLDRSEKSFDTSLGHLWSVKKGDIYELDNWQQLA